MKIKVLENVAFSFTGSNVLDQIQDRSTPSIDLLIRESIQNCADAAKENAKFVTIDYKINTFSNLGFLSLLNLDERFNYSNFTKGSNYYLAINDTNTTGLLGPHIKKEGVPQNLYNLVYDLMNKKGKTGSSGGSWGIGKSVYYRFGKGFCIYYSRTFENGNYLNKLAITFIEDETKPNKVINAKNNRGIAFFGDLDEQNNPMPIYGENEIKQILEVFNESLYEADETGTKIIIPYLDLEKFENYSINHENCWWHNDFKKNLNETIQRWYFARLNNLKFKGKYLKININDEEVELNKFYELMQNMYNGELEDCQCFDIASKSPAINFGKLYLKKFKVNELFMLPPNNYPTPLCMFDLEEDFKRETPIIGYMRGTGMVITYDHKWNDVTVGDDEYVLGLFILDDEREYLGEKIVEYIRGSEKANHKEWKDAVVEDFPNCSAKTIVSKIFANINRIATENFKQTETIEIETSTSKLRRKLGKLLLPPSGFGNSADVGRQKSNPEKGGSKAVSKKKKVKIDFNGFENGLLIFETNVFLESQDKILFDFLINSGIRKYTFEEWHNMGFTSPFKLETIKIENLIIGKNEIKGKGNYKFDELKNIRKSIEKSILIDFHKLEDDYHGIAIENIEENKKDISLTFTLYVRPIDTTYSISVASSILCAKNRGIE